MPGGGLLALVAYGTQNVILSGNPDMTYFFKTFRKYTHFSLETTSKLMDGPTDYTYDSSIQLRARIDRTGDLLTDMYFSFQIPAVYSKERQIDPVNGPRTQEEFQWVRCLGAAAIQTVYITVGPGKIQEFTGEYLMSKALIDYPADQFEKWQQLVGDVPELYNPANGLYGNITGTSSEYPTVYRDIRNPSAAQTNTPSIPAYTVYVPLPFWFTEQGQALPLISLQYYTVDVTINLNPSRNLYTVLDPSGVRMAPGFRTLTPTTSLQSNIPDFFPYPDNDTQIRKFFVDISGTPSPLNLWGMNPTLHTTYAFLPDSERTVFSSASLMYPVRQVTLVPFPEIVSNQLLDLEVHNPITRLIFVPRRSDTLLYRNGFSNFTNWWDYPRRPKIPTHQALQSSFIQNDSASGVLVPNGQLEIIQFLRILSDGNQIQEMKPGFFYTALTPYRYLSGKANRQLPVYTFELNSPTFQPCGSLNASRIRKLQVDLSVFPLPPNSSYIYSINIYVESLNFFLVESGMGDVKYAI
uniref:Major capsid protein N-terminal domain-containing protein n=1 Tax=viral metagenome TaxID=1070528 RepID=A0A6C0DPS4_9ZZZZ